MIYRYFYCCLKIFEKITFLQLVYSLRYVVYNQKEKIRNWKLNSALTS